MVGKEKQKHAEHTAKAEPLAGGSGPTTKVPSRWRVEKSILKSKLKSILVP